LRPPILNLANRKFKSHIPFGNRGENSAVKNLSLAAALGILICVPFASQASAASCYDLWYQRNQIYSENGYCFKTQLGRDTFGNAGCFTNNPKLSKYEARDVKEIKQEEKKRGCKVN
jgi:hypothetical protein